MFKFQPCGRRSARLIRAATMPGSRGETMPAASSRSRQVRTVRSDSPVYRTNVATDGNAPVPSGPAWLAGLDRSEGPTSRTTLRRRHPGVDRRPTPAAAHPTASADSADRLSIHAGTGRGKQRPEPCRTNRAPADAIRRRMARKTTADQPTAAGRRRGVTRAFRSNRSCRSVLICVGLPRRAVPGIRPGRLRAWGRDRRRPGRRQELSSSQLQL